MKRLIVLLFVLPLAGCLAFEETFYDDVAPDWPVAVPSGCAAAPPSVPAITNRASSLSPSPGPQTREPDLMARP